MWRDEEHALPFRNLPSRLMKFLVPNRSTWTLEFHEFLTIYFYCYGEGQADSETLSLIFSRVEIFLFDVGFSEWKIRKIDFSLTKDRAF